RLEPDEDLGRLERDGALAVLRVHRDGLPLADRGGDGPRPEPSQGGVQDLLALLAPETLAELLADGLPVGEDVELDVPVEVGRERDVLDVDLVLHELERRADRLRVLGRTEEDDELAERLALVDLRLDARPVPER